MSTFSDYFKDDDDYGWLWDLGDTALDSDVNLEAEIIYENNALGGIHTEGDDISASITTDSYVFGKKVYWQISGNNISQNDLSSNNLVGSGVFDSQGKFTFSDSLVEDNLVEGTETLDLQFFSDPLRLKQIGTKVSFLVFDASKPQTIYSVSYPSYKSILDEGSSIEIDVTTSEYVPMSRAIYWELSGLGIDRHDFTSGYTSDYNFLWPDNRVTIRLGISADKVTEGAELFQIKIKDDFNDIETLSFLINDKYKTPNYSIKASHQKIYEGKYLQINGTTNIPSGSYIYWNLSGPSITGGDVDWSLSFTGLESSSLVDEQGNFSFVRYIEKDNILEGNEDLNIKFYSDYWRREPISETISVQIMDYQSLTDVAAYDLLNTKIINDITSKLKTSSVVFDQNFSDYIFYNLGKDRYAIKTNSGIDEITGLTTIEFNDKTISLDSDIKETFDQVTGLNTDSGEMFRLYNAAFARFPDADGLKYWIDEFSSGRNTRRVVSKSFLASSEFEERYGANITHETYVKNLYLNVLNRELDQSGYDYWVGNLNDGVEQRYEVLLGFSESDENKLLFTEMTGFG